jgi:DNA integrity scanning protein DisA with diadenylate cyclase activity
MYKDEPIACFTRNAMVARLETASSLEVDLFERGLDLALEIAWEGWEGRRVGTIFTLGKPQRLPLRRGSDSVTDCRASRGGIH